MSFTLRCPIFNHIIKKAKSEWDAPTIGWLYPNENPKIYWVLSLFEEYNIVPNDNEDDENEDQEHLIDDLEFYKTAKAENEARLRTEQEQEEFVINEKFKNEIALFKKYGKDTAELEIAQLNEINEIRLKYQQKDYDAKEASRQLEIQAVKEASQKRIELEDKQFEVMQSIGQTEKEKEIADLVKSYEDKFAIVGDNAELEKELTEQQKKDLAVIEEKYRKTQAEKDKEAADKNIALQRSKLQMTADAFGAIGGLIESFNAKDEASARKQFKIAKAFNLAAAITNTYLGITDALAKDGTFPGSRFIAAGTVATTGLASIVKIASTQFGSGGGGGNNPVPTGGGGVIAPNLNVVGDTGINQLATLQQQPIKAYVVSNDITSAQQFDLKVQQTASL